MKLFLICITTFLLSIWTDDVSAKIYICVDDKGRKHYSDKMCPKESTTRTEYYTVKGKTIPPRNVTDFTPVLKLARESLALLILLEPDQPAYTSLYKIINSAHTSHTKFVNYPNAAEFPGYDPLGAQLQDILIDTLSNACRIRGHLTICAAIEGNPWLSSREEQHYQLGKKSPNLSSRHCEKARRAHSGGVIGRGMQHFFCEETN